MVERSKESGQRGGGHWEGCAEPVRCFVQRVFTSEASSFGSPWRARTQAFSKKRVAIVGTEE
eukprot:6173281-Pleurochrysis_carterae.AAC.2